MSDQQQTPLHKWEIVSQGENATTLACVCPAAGCIAISRTSRARHRVWRSYPIRPLRTERGDPCLRILQSVAQITA